MNTNYGKKRDTYNIKLFFNFYLLPFHKKFFKIDYLLCVVFDLFRYLSLLLTDPLLTLLSLHFRVFNGVLRFNTMKSVVLVEILKKF